MYRYNHYVPEWYQKRFLPKYELSNKIYYLDLKPETFYDSKAKVHYDTSIHRFGFRKCFAKDDLYTIFFGNDVSTKIEEKYFGDIDNKAPLAVDFFANFTHPSMNNDAFRDLLKHMGTQKLRTPKGLAFLRQKAGTTDQNQILQLMVQLQRLYLANWTECVWLIADATQSDTKFIISDHPVTVYNRRCGPHSQWCREYNDPDIWFHGTHTIFPLSLDKILILTNLSWVRNPYRSEISLRPNANPQRDAIFKYWDIQTLRHLNEQEVREINFIIKSRALRFIAAAKEEWLFPDKFISKSQWNEYGDGYLLMPDPRSVNLGGEIIWGNDSGRIGSLDEYGRLPEDKEYNKESNSREEFNSFHKFQGEFARIYGPNRRGRAFRFGKLDPEKDGFKYHEYHLGLERNIH